MRKSLSRFSLKRFSQKYKKKEKENVHVGQEILFIRMQRF